MTRGEDFFEEDEPVEDVISAFRTGQRGVTAPPHHQHGWTQHLDLGATVVRGETVFGWTFGELTRR